MSRRWPLAVVGILAAGGAAVAAGLFLWPSGEAATTCAGPVHAPVPADAQEALATYTGKIKHTLERSVLGTAKESWLDSSTGNNHDVQYDTAGKVTSEFATVPLESKERYVWILHDQGVWMSYIGPGGAPAAADSALLEAQGYRDKVANGEATLIGRELIDGRRTMHLREQISAMPFDAWVDALTYVPVQTRTGPPGHRSQTATTWLPRTPANLAHTKVTIPHGLKRVAPMSLGGGGDAGGFVLSAPGQGCAQS